MNCLQGKALLDVRSFPLGEVEGAIVTERIARSIEVQVLCDVIHREKSVPQNTVP